MNNFSVKKAWEQIKSSLETFIVAFSTMSSVVAMPLILRDAKKYVANKDYPGFIIPFVINIHMIGSSVIFGVLIVMVLYFFGKPMPSILSFISFLYYYSLARFSIAGVPGGSAMIMAGLVKSQFDFTDDMVAVFMTLDLLLDGLMTAGNAMGNILYTQWSYKVFGSKIFSKGV